MKQFNFPTVLLYGEGALDEACSRMKGMGFNKPLLVTDKTLVSLGMADQLVGKMSEKGVEAIVYDGTHSNPIEQDCIDGADIYIKSKCDSVVALGGGSPMDVAKGIMVLATNDGPLAKYDDAKGGDRFVVNPLPPLIAIPTTAGTGSEVGRAGVIIIKETNNKTILFHPTMMPKMAVLDPQLTVGLPKPITVATGLDAFTHSLEAYFACGFHPMADGIAVEGMDLVLENLGLVVENGENLEGRAKMLLAASMGATAFQKGLGMIHAIAHPLSSECGLHHGLANALVLPFCVKFLESAKLNEDQKERINKVRSLFEKRSMAKKTLSQTCTEYFESLGIEFGLAKHGVKENQIQTIAEKAFLDVSHQTNMIPVTTEDFVQVIKESM